MGPLQGRAGSEAPRPAPGGAPPAWDGGAGGQGRAVRLFIVGPTASGKSGLALRVAQRLGGEVLSVDSMKVYRRMDIGTAKPRGASTAGVPIHLIDLVEPWESMSVARFCAAARQVEAEVRARGRLPVFAGGTALYVRALTEGLFEGPAADPELRAALRAEAARHGPGALHARLAALDPVAAARLHPNDLRRVIRALEVHAKTGHPISELQRQWQDAPRPDRMLVGLRWERSALAARIEQRVDRMFAEGLVEEVRRLRAEPRGLSPQAAQALGYRELLAWLEEGEREPLAELAARIKRNTRRFARRQLNFFSHLPDIHWIGVDASTEPDRLADEVCERFLAACGGRLPAGRG
ncbi:MAG: tRNA dimethylallyltransferase [Planctomycetota bacterium]|nr:MAG: tRNA dimethylallyltransferase [Planctomycetota bacterium]